MQHIRGIVSSLNVSRLKKHTQSRWFALALITLLTLIYFIPVLLRLGTYMTGGDPMFNAWVLERNQHCILRQHCPDYVNANIYYPNKDTMLYSEVEISPSIVSMPLHFLDSNPILPYNIVTILTVLMLGFSMYWLALYLSKGHQGYSIFAGLLFEFGPINVAGVWHLQTLSVFCFPLIFLMIFKYLDTRARKYLIGLFFVLLYCFYASWYVMVFMVATLGFAFVLFLVQKRASLKTLGVLVGVCAAACVLTLPLALQYLKFDRQSNATYTLQEKVLNSTNLVDYAVTPGFTLAGQFMRLVLGGKRDASLYNHTATLSYAGISLFVVTLVIGPCLLWRKRRSLPAALKSSRQTYVLFGSIAVLAFIISLGPLLKIGQSYVHTISGQPFVVPLPMLLIHLFVPQLGFLRQSARASALVIFAFCCMLAVLAGWVPRLTFYKRHVRLITIIVVAIIAVDVLPAKVLPLDSNPHAYHSDIPAVYQFVKQHSKIDNIIVLQAEDYPHVTFWFARTEDVLWSGYYNRNLYNGYSGYVPPTYEAQYSDFVNLDPSDPAKMRAVGLRYVIVDDELYTNKPTVLKSVPSILGKPIYQDVRYQMYKL